MPRVIADIISPKELIERFKNERQETKNELKETTSSSSHVAKKLGDRIRQIINQENDYLDEELQVCFHEAAILLDKLPEDAQRRMMHAILNQTQQDLDLYRLRLDEEHANIIADLLYFTGVTSLNVGHNKIGDKGACDLAQNTSLLKLFVYGNKISYERMHQIICHFGLFGFFRCAFDMIFIIIAKPCL